MSVKQLSDGNPDGTTLGQDSTDKIAFYGATPVVKQGGPAMAAPASAYVATASGYGFQSSAKFLEAMATLEAAREALVNVGIAATS